MYTRLRKLVVSIYLIAELTLLVAAAPSGGGRVRVLASWYGKTFQGRTTTAGNPYDRWALVCAHRNLPLGRWVRLRNPRSQRVCMARVEDRGPYHKDKFGNYDRDIDVSEMVALRLGVKEEGVFIVEMEVLGVSNR